MSAYTFALTGDCLLSKTIVVDAADAAEALATFASMSAEAINALPWYAGALNVDEYVSVESTEDDAEDIDELDESVREVIEAQFG
ncbi:hypothetical protein [Luteimonas fraxinea]|uniref:Uncharacterized protein n=1 Tax=Luteimonas fraxinea TaxID=2901869 RepID=A0ABS8UBT4_9GAMM|nr:hypothetical protein [Luteimonas fraxinea]MCD9096699.1 hypothetical protein [Luteimonas fraxinea]MCD9126068.1 hypothetical protein [Luteimonas fraxinea]